jgi:exodeoxyribonuclease VII large subunit
MDNQYLSLFQLNQLIKKTLSDWLPETVLVVAEISKISLHHSGHCYLDLVDKPENGSIRAKCCATIWKNRYTTISRNFETKTGQPLKVGLKILFNATVQYHELYGLALDIHAIDPNYTLGDLAQQKQQTIKRIQNEGLELKNKKLPFPKVSQRIAVISSPTAAGLGDFVKQLQDNCYGYKFKVSLFEAAMQGNDASLSIANALRNIATQQAFFDAVVMVRGGGASLDLSCFDTYDLAYIIAHFQYQC